MKKVLSVILILLLAGISVSAPPAKSDKGREVANEPKLVVLICIDQMRFDYLTRFRDQFTGGLKYLLDRGAVFTHAHHSHAITETGPGHSVLLSGKYVKDSGIVNNLWFDRKSDRLRYVVEDKAYPLLKASENGASPSGISPSGISPSGISPENFRGYTLGDKLKEIHKRSKVVSISQKDRAAVLMGGKRADEVYWYDSMTGQFVTSRFYRKEYPEWVVQFNARKLPDTYFGKAWDKLLADPKAYERSGEDDFKYELDGKHTVFPHSISNSPKPDPTFYNLLLLTPYGDELLLAFAKDLVKNTQVGKGASPDIFAISFSSTDYIGHAYGPFSHEIQDQILRLDRILEELFNFLDREVGLAQTLIVLSADHGVMPIPEYLQRQGIEAGRIDPIAMEKEVEKTLNAKFKTSEKWIRAFQPPMVYFNRTILKKYSLNPVQFANETAKIIARTKGVARIYTREQLSNGKLPADSYASFYANTFNPERCGDLIIQPKKYYIFSGQPTGTTHGSPYEYDTHVPIIFSGRTIKPGFYDDKALVNDIAPTLARMLKIDYTTAPGSKVHTEILLNH